MVDEHGYRLRAPDGTEKGPLSRADLQRMWQEGAITDRWEASHTLVPGWRPVRDILPAEAVETVGEPPAAQEHKEPDPKAIQDALAHVGPYKGLRGWLILVGIQIWLGLLRGVVALDDTIKMTEDFPWSRVSQQAPKLYDAMLVNVGFQWAYVIAAVVLLYLFHAKKAIFPHVFIAIYIGMALSLFYLSYLWTQVPGDEMEAEITGP